ncbi:MAG: hypothetical protein Tsb0034_11900 [Ekhidna sp.]
MIKKHTTTLFKTIAVFILISCSEDPADPVNGVDGQDGFNALVNIEDEPSGTNCSSGGVAIAVGQDTNENGQLDNAEILSINYVCNGSEGTSSSKALVARTSPENPGSNCEAGGTLVEIGLDDNENNILDDTEVQSSFFVCNGLDGQDGADGSNGGNNGTDGSTSLIVATPEEPGDNCSAGGIKLQMGIDDNDNGELDAGEVVSTNYICNGEAGSNGTNGYNTLIVTNNSPSGCANGGYQIKIGTDLDRDGILDEPDELQETFEICNGSNSLIEVNSFSGSAGSCRSGNGGLRIDAGVDDNGNGTLDFEEIDHTEYVCNGSDGAPGNSDNIYEFYFTEGFNGYTGVLDGSISAKNGPDVSSPTFSMDIGGIEYHGVVYFPEINTNIEAVTGTTTNTVVEAVLYLRGLSTQIDGSENNWIGAKVILPSAPLLDLAFLSWSRANDSQNWTEPGGITSQSANQDAYGYSDMFMLPYNFQFDGYIPLLLNKSEIQEWVESETGKDANKGVVLLMAANNVPYNLDIYSSRDEKNKDFRPTLYLKIKTDVKGRGESVSNATYKERWAAKTYEEKLAPLMRRK